MEKLFPAWNDKYKVDNERIDSQHKELFRLASQVENCFYKFVKREELKNVLTELFAYMRDHFKDEENYMQEIGYPHLNAHKQMHKVIINDMSFLIQNIRTTNDLKEKLYTIIGDWLTKHILYHDMMISQWLKENQDSGTQEIKKANISAEMVFIYTCPCHTIHKLGYQEHINILGKNEEIQCKKCKKALVFVKTEEYVKD